MVFKYIILSILSVTSIVSCKNKSHNESRALKNNVQKKDILLLGDSLIANEGFVKKINKTCAISNGYYGRTEADIDDYKSKCVFYNIKFQYEKLKKVDNKIIKNFKGINYIIRNSNVASNADDYIFKDLILKKNNIITDSIKIYSYEGYIEALVVISEYYYIKDNHLWVLNFYEDEEGIHVESWSKYEINDLGRIVSLE